VGNLYGTFPVTLDVFGNATQGARDYQEDSFEICTDMSNARDVCLAIVCDGMGGHNGGALASRTATKVFANTFIKQQCDANEALQTSLHAAHQALIEQVEQRLAPSDMGTTLVAACISHDSLYWISVGDSHLYHYRGGQLNKLNADHSMAPVLDELCAVGRISEEEALSDPQRNSIRSCLSASAINLIDTGTREQFLQPGDKLLFASDGLDTLPPHKIAALFKSHKHASAHIIADALLNKIKEVNRPGQDNTAVIVITVDAKHSGVLQRVRTWFLGMLSSR